ncbi:MAG TPA: MiaB/RimO family radical SAM methylthiotransferase, partial [Clostridiaceae bacterium]|nr:MiaB/RimO family radical SAM methylthiotransferase [Clostridiaceae bacterium]
ESELSDLDEWADLCIGTTGRNLIVKEVLKLLEERGRDLSSISSSAWQLADKLAADSQDSDGSVFEDPQVSVTPSDSRAQLKICDGCNNRCTYCTICLARGPVRSRQLDSIVAEATDLVSQGYREIVLTGVHICSYGDDFHGQNSDLAQVLASLNSIKGLTRIRLGSLDPARITSEFVESISHFENLCPHFHLSMQSGSNAVLKRMGRHYDSAKFREVAAMLRSVWPEAALTTDVMCGFPGETDEDHRQTVELCQEVGFTKIHVFPYSRRSETAAASMPNQVPSEIAKERTQEMLDLSDHLSAAYCSRRIGDSTLVLLEREISPGIGEGYTRTYLPCRFQINYFGSKAHPGDIFLVNLEEYKDGYLYGTGSLCDSDEDNKRNYI